MEGAATGRSRHELAGGLGGLCSLERLLRGGKQLRISTLAFMAESRSSFQQGVHDDHLLLRLLHTAKSPVHATRLFMDPYILLLLQAAAPGLAWSTFFEEPAMLLAFVLLGRTLEQRAKIAASSNLLALQACNASPDAAGPTQLANCPHVHLLMLSIDGKHPAGGVCLLHLCSDIEGQTVKKVCCTCRSCCLQRRAWRWVMAAGRTCRQPRYPGATC
jgi:hypothetical protein